MRWIPVEVKEVEPTNPNHKKEWSFSNIMPKNFQEIWITTENGNLYHGTYYDDSAFVKITSTESIPWFNPKDIGIPYIIAWMPYAPAPYKKVIPWDKTNNYRDLQDIVESFENNVRILKEATIDGFKEALDKGFKQGHEEGKLDSYTDGYNDRAFEEKKEYEKGYQDGLRDQGQKDAETFESYLEGHRSDKEARYQQGLNDAWEAARKLTHPRYGGYYDDTKLEIFGYRNSDDVLTMLSASEAIAKIKEYEKKQTKKSCHNCGKTSCGGRKDDPDIPCLNWVAKQTDDEIQVGDEIKIYTSSKEKGYYKAVVTAIDEDLSLWIVSESGANFLIDQDDTIKKTGRHFDAIEEVLEQMREDNND